mmetsp:Transcript_59119/g.157286  ORF Transcript_59119/g.157286 Transcript_59119/m.157286 type:complete len:344 (-) Transcript_59119:1530-2561(-)
MSPHRSGNQQSIHKKWSQRSASDLLLFDLGRQGEYRRVHPHAPTDAGLRTADGTRSDTTADVRLENLRAARGVQRGAPDPAEGVAALLAALRPERALERPHGGRRGGSDRRLFGREGGEVLVLIVHAEPGRELHLRWLRELRLPLPGRLGGRLARLQLLVALRLLLLLFVARRQVLHLGTVVGHDGVGDRAQHQQQHGQEHEGVEQRQGRQSQDDDSEPDEELQRAEEEEQRAAGRGGCRADEASAHDLQCFAHSLEALTFWANMQDLRALVSVRHMEVEAEKVAEEYDERDHLDRPDHPLQAHDHEEEKREDGQYTTDHRQTRQPTVACEEKHCQEAYQHRD